MELTANLVDLYHRRVYPAKIGVQRGHICKIDRVADSVDESLQYVLPGFVDAHIHIESSMLVPTAFARLALPHGTVAVVTDPHEIANVMGVPGIDFMIENATHTPLKCFFGAPSCVPATEFETAGANIDADAIADLLKREDIHYLAEMMNYPGVLAGDPQVMAKIQHARRLGKQVDGHAPGLVGQDAVDYINAGISTDHECTELEEAIHKINHGMKILIREGSAAKNFDALHPLLLDYPSRVMLCSDDKHPDDLVLGHINLLVKRAISLGYDLFDVLRAACINPVEHYGLNVGTLREGDPGDMVIVNDLKSFDIVATYIEGEKVADANGAVNDSVAVHAINNFRCSRKSHLDFQVDQGSEKAQVIRAIDGSLVTEREILDHSTDEHDDTLKITVVDRYSNGPPAVGWIRGFGLTQGAIASCVAHDSHNIVAVGVDDESLTLAVNTVIDQMGGIAAVSSSEHHCLPLCVGGIMSAEDGYSVAKRYEQLDRFAKQVLGCVLTAPFMTLSFMALLVIPKLKISDKGLFDAEAFEFVRTEHQARS